MKRRIAYTYVYIDVFHYGHLRLLERAKSLADYHVCGLMTDRVGREQLGVEIMNYEERRGVLESIRCVDEVIPQDSASPEENLRILHERFPEDEILLFQGHQDWMFMPGAEYVKSIGGSVVKPEYYPRLSREVIAKKYYDMVVGTHHPSLNFNERVSLGNLKAFESPLGSKADTLERMRPLLKRSRVEPLFIFTVEGWRRDQDKILRKIQLDFKGETLAVRSSALTEDLTVDSQAGRFRTLLGVDASRSDAIQLAVENVIASFARAGEEAVGHQILIQRFTPNVQIAGVVFTRKLESNTPYYCIHYDASTGRTDSVTGGWSDERLEILRTVDTGLLEQPWRSLIDAIREIEELLAGLVLDIEFAVTRSGDVVIFQVRSLAANARFYTLDEHRIFDQVDALKASFRERCRRESRPVLLSDMAFWNPAEIIGDRPKPLDYSLYDELVMDGAWNEGLRPLGYSRVSGSLMWRFASKPYVDVELALRALLPMSLPEEIRSRIAAARLEALKRQPELHDKIEFGIMIHAWSFDETGLRTALGGSLSASETTRAILALKRLTCRMVSGSRKMAADDRKKITRLVRRVRGVKCDKGADRLLAEALKLLEICRRDGVLPFVRAARCAFVSKSLLQGLVHTGVLTEEESTLFLTSIKTVAGQFEADSRGLYSRKLSIREFVNRYGHLRPSTYDITRPTYREMVSGGLLPTGNLHPVSAPALRSAGSTLEAIEHKIDHAWRTAHPSSGPSVTLSAFIRTSIALREEFKFEFTKALSLLIDLIAKSGLAHGMTREEMAFLDLDTLRVALSAGPATVTEIWRSVVQSRKEAWASDRLIALPGIIMGEGDFERVKHRSTLPNFITQKTAFGSVVCLDGQDIVSDKIRGAVVLIERADPGFDWIFAAQPAALVTRFGGAASHMAIRCAEFGLPAAIGCGENLYDRLKYARFLKIDGSRRTIEPAAAAPKPAGFKAAVS